MDNLVNTLGVLGAYFAVILVLAVAVETILDPFTLIKGLRKKVSPEELIKDLKDWVPSNSGEKEKIDAINSIAKQTQKGVKEVQDCLKEIAAVADNASSLFGPEMELKKNELITILYKNQYNLSEKKRIVILRVLSAIIGVLISYIIQIDSFALLSGLFSIETAKTFSTPLGHYGGILLTGLAASAGSSFWHDQLAKVRAAKTLIPKKEKINKE